MHKIVVLSALQRAVVRSSAIGQFDEHRESAGSNAKQSKERFLDHGTQPE